MPKRTLNKNRCWRSNKKHYSSHTSIKNWKRTCYLLPLVHTLTGCDYTSKVGTKALNANPSEYFKDFDSGPSCTDYLKNTQVFEWSKMYMKITKNIFLTFQCIININISESMIWQVSFGGSVKLSHVPDFRDPMTFGVLINILICIKIILMNRLLKYKHFK